MFFHEHINKDKIHVYLLVGYGGESYVTLQEGVRRGGGGREGVYLYRLSLW